MRLAQHQLNVKALGGDVPRWPAPPSALPVPALLDLDHALLGKGWTAARAERGPSLGSDHFPLLLNLEPEASAYAH
jgi:endonuclease/exonuclease/phosphatase (EEP) superfamily protein YafD